MNIFADNKWQAGFLDYYRSKDEYRIETIAWKNLNKIERAYIVRPRSIKMVLNYLFRFGPKVTLRKIISRLNEKYRNEKYISIGIGKILDAPSGGIFKTGKVVGFLAPFHPPVAERIVLTEEFIVEINNLPEEISPDEKFVYYTALKTGIENKWWQGIEGWSVYAGKILDEDKIKKIKEEIIKSLTAIDWKKSLKLEKSKSEVKEIKADSAKIKRQFKNGKTACLLGYGNYAKTQIIPNIKQNLNLVAVHEIDPTQIGPVLNRNTKIKIWDTSPYIRKGEQYDVFLIAGFHHTHAPLAIEAIKKNAYALVEKPIAVDGNQLNELLDANKKNPGKLFAGFHKRYSPFNQYLKKDLSIPSKPFNYHCVVYEEPQPEYYWYNWPNSKGPIVANGCHWIDHFLFLNNFVEVDNYSVWASKDGKTVNVSLELKNGSNFTMVLTDKGGSSIGVQDYVEIRTQNKTARIINDSRYESESSKGIIRKVKINKAKNYELMYKAISQKIANNKSGDSQQSLRVSTETMLKLEQRYQQLTKK